MLGGYIAIYQYMTRLMNEKIEKERLTQSHMMDAIIYGRSMLKTASTPLTFIINTEMTTRERLQAETDERLKGVLE